MEREKGKEGEREGTRERGRGIPQATKGTLSTAGCTMGHSAQRGKLNSPGDISTSL